MTAGPGTPLDDLPARSLRALAWNYAGTGTRAVAQLAITVVLARLLGPEEFGTVAMGLLVLGVGTLVADLGLGAVVVQRPRLTGEDVRFAAAMQLGLGAVLCAAGLAGAGAIAGWFGHPSAAPVVRAMSLLFVVQSVGATPLALLRRELDFRTTQVITVVSYVAGYGGIGIPGALAGWGAWSLVAAQLAYTACSTAAALLRSPRPYRLGLRPSDPALLALGGKVAGTNLVNWALSNVDATVVGRMLGADALGLYGRALALPQAPATALTSSLQGVLFSACSRAQSDRELLRRAYLGATGALASIVLPIYLTLACVAGTVVEALYGARWLPAAALVTPLALATAANALAALPGPVLGAVNRFGVELRVQLVALLVAIPAVALAGRESTAAVAWTVAALKVAQLAALARAVSWIVGGDGASVSRVLRWPLAAGVATAGATLVADRLLAGGPALARLGADLLVAAGAVVLCVRAFGRRWTSDGGFAAALPMGSLPPAVRSWLVAEEPRRAPEAGATP